MRWILTVSLITAAAAARAQPLLPQGAPARVPLADRSYALGIELGRQLRTSLVDVDPETVARGVQDALSDRPLRLTEEEIRAAFSDLQVDRKRKIALMRRLGATDNRELGGAFLAANKEKEGVQTLPSGLQYKVLKAGDGQVPTLDDTVVCNYRGTLVSGVEFDSTYARGAPAKLPVKSLIKGWSEALQRMPVGSRWQLFIPADLAYGERGAGDLVGPDAALIFEVELMSIAGKRS